MLMVGCCVRDLVAFLVLSERQERCRLLIRSLQVVTDGNWTQLLSAGNYSTALAVIVGPQGRDGVREVV